MTMSAAGRIGRPTFVGIAIAALFVICACQRRPTPQHATATASPPILYRAQEPETQPARPPPLPGRNPTAHERSIISRLKSTTARIRALPFVSEIQVRIQTREQIVAHTRLELQQDKFEASRRAYVALRMLDPGLNILSVLLDVVSEQVLGYYEPTTKTLVVRDDVMRALKRGTKSRETEAAQEVLVHELVHALQDQHLDLALNLASSATTDQRNALRAAIEGDATLAATAYALGRAGEAETTLLEYPARLHAEVEALTRAVEHHPNLSAAPAIIAAPIAFYYRQGLVFAAERLAGARSYARLNASIQHPPQTTAKILHPAGRRSGTDILHRELPSAALLNRGFVLETLDSLGELELSIYLRPGNGIAVADRTASHWRADSLRIYRAPERSEPVAVWVILVDEPEAARRLEAAVRARNRATCGSCTDAYVSRQRLKVIVQHGVPRRWTREITQEAVSSQLDPPERAH